MIEQLAIALTGVTAIVLIQSGSERLRRFACLFGLAGQPAWFYFPRTRPSNGAYLACACFTRWHGATASGCIGFGGLGNG